MASSTVEIVIKAKDETKKALSGIKGSLQTLAGVALKVGIGAAAGIGLIGAGMWKLATDAAAFEPVRLAFAKLAEAAGTSTDDLLAALRDASEGMITDTELMSKANLAMLLIGEQVAEALPDLLAIAQTAALTTGQDFDFLFDSLVRGVGRMSPRILDNLGLTIDLTDAYEGYASEMGLVADELTVAEQQQAVLNAVLDKGAEMIDKVAFKTEDLASVQLAQLRTTFSNITDQLGQAFIPILLAVLEPLGDLAEEYGPAVVAWGQEFASWLTDEGVPAVQNFIGVAIEWTGSFMEVWVPRLQEAQAVAETVWGAIQEVIQTVTSIIQTTIDTVTGIINQIWGDNHDQIQSTAETVWEIIRSAIEIATDAIQRIIDNTLGTILGWWDENHELIQATTETVWNAIETFINTTLTFIMDDIITPILTEIKKFWDEHGEKILTIVETVWGMIETFVDTTINAVLGIIRAVMLLIQGDWDEAWEEIKKVASTIWGGIETIVDDAINVVKGTLDIVLTELKAIWDTQWGAIKTKLDDIWEDIKTAISTKITEIQDIIVGWLGSIITAISERLGSFYDAGRAIVEGLKSGVQSMAGALVDAALAAVQDAINAVKGWLGIACPDPSPVWAELGVGMGEGMIVGFQSTVAAMQAAVTQGVGGLSGAMNFSMAGAAAGGAAAQSFASGGRGRGVTINIGNLYGTDRQAARRFSRLVADDLRRQGVLA